MNIEVRIDHLVLEGLPVDSAQGDLVRVAVEAELTRLFTVGGAASGLTRGDVRPEAHVGEIHFGADDTPARLGERIGRAIHGGIER
jgi:hypothetical protein